MTTLLVKKTTSSSELSTSKSINEKCQCEYPDCDKLYSKKHDLKTHISSYHENIRFNCEYPECGKSYTYQVSSISVTNALDATMNFRKNPI